MGWGKREETGKAKVCVYRCACVFVGRACMCVSVCAFIGSFVVCVALLLFYFAVINAFF